jgi:hypothetical protein
MKRNGRNAVAAISNGEAVGSNAKGNGRSGPDTAPADLVAILASLQTMRDGGSFLPWNSMAALPITVLFLQTNWPFSPGL